MLPGARALGKGLWSLHLNPALSIRCSCLPQGLHQSRKSSPKQSQTDKEKGLGLKCLPHLLTAVLSPPALALIPGRITRKRPLPLELTDNTCLLGAAYGGCLPLISPSHACPTRCMKHNCYLLTVHKQCCVETADTSTKLNIFPGDLGVISEQGKAQCGQTQAGQTQRSRVESLSCHSQLQPC